LLNELKEFVILLLLLRLFNMVFNTVVLTVPFWAPSRRTWKCTTLKVFSDSFIWKNWDIFFCIFYVYSIRKSKAWCLFILYITEDLFTPAVTSAMISEMSDLCKLQWTW